MKIKNFFNWFLGVEKHNNRFYGEDDAGRRVFYPWGKPGEAYYLTKKQEIIFGIPFYILTACFFIVAFGGMYLGTQERINSDILDFVVFLNLFALFIAYLISAFFLHKNCEPYLVEVENREGRDRKNWQLYFLILIVFLNAFALFFNLWINSPSLYEALSSVFMMLVIIGIIVWLYILKKNKGYIFNK